MEGSVVLERHKWLRSAWTFLKIVILVVIVTFFVHHFFFTNYVVSGKSMLPTIQDGEHVIINKIEYDWNAPQRFDLIVFRATPETDYIKRVIGVPSDEIRYENDHLYINDELYEEPFLEQEKRALLDETFTYDFTLEQVTGEGKVPNDKYFVLGDNRPNSMDSRQLGFISKDRIIGKVDITYWPLKRLRMF
ncbi:signal peptidase I [Texcoconibacillus texcoconensis]|uniref:Signal peptidase I n=1 Tax=Texcoconibacillus texcoconensis TaxID=1095777 RepID=A0A840QPQ3_9BACI|nr:signal peptidase I [Texcoconibacillus texcoconensis]MBB5173339.1 signal peptidase I [Texcoconibacillus texcoconensis]